MRLLLGLLFLIVLVAGCKKDKTPTPEPAPALTKWELISGHYKVYDSTGVFIYEMDITHSTGTSAQGYRTDSLHFDKLDNQFDLTIKQEDFANFPDMVTTGSQTAILDSIGNRWDLFSWSPDYYYNNFRNDTIVFYVEKHNTPYWWNDGTQYFHGFLKHIAVKQ